MDQPVSTHGLKRTVILGAALDDRSAAEVVEAIFAVLDGGGRARVINANAYMLNLTYETPWLRELFRQSEINLSGRCYLNLWCDCAISAFRSANWLPIGN
jgi:hypothetical protein